MRSKKTYFMILMALAIMVLVGMFFNVPPLSGWVNSLQGMLNDWRVALAALVCALLFSRYRGFWGVMLVCSLVMAIAIQLIFFGSGIDLYTTTLRMIWFLIVAYLVDYARMILKL